MSDSKTTTPTIEEMIDFARNRMVRAQELDRALRDWVERQSATNTGELYRQALKYFEISPAIPD